MVGLSDPIVAISSPPGVSGRGVVRASGEGLGAVVEDLFGAVIEERRLTTARLRLTDDTALPCLVMWRPGPASFTGQDVLEVQAPGNPVLLERVVLALLGVFRDRLGGGRLAEPGEFSQRAFLSGKIDLTRAEGIAATIGAVSDAQLEAARLLRTGRLGRWAETLTERYALLLGLVEAGIDFVDQDDVVAITAESLDEGLAGIEGELKGLLGKSRSWSSLESLPWVVLVGSPNAGKSTLFNRLLGRERAVTSRRAGTTRDVLSEALRVGDGEVMLVDVAGLEGGLGVGVWGSVGRTSQGGDEANAGLIDQSMRDAARTAIDRAELVVWLRAGDKNPVALSEEVRGWVGDTTVMPVWSKADLVGGAGGVGRSGSEKQAGEWVSGETGEGVAELRARIEDAVRGRAVSVGGRVLALQERHRDRLDACLEAVCVARGLVQPSLGAEIGGVVMEMELVAGVMREGLDALGELGGVMTADDVIGKIFSTFCIGK